MIDSSLHEKLKKISVLAMDVDGVLTDGGIILGTGGAEHKVFNVQDGMGITLARTAGLKTAIITGRSSQAVERRAGELRFDEVFQGSKNKKEAFSAMLKRFNASPDQVCYIGDDLLDMQALRMAGVGIAVANAREELKREAHIITRLPGGHGAVREAVEIILKAQNLWNSIVKTFY